ncbi:oligosaccharide flippase family protein [Patescibacteria group bacterium]|nr:oligosaccharide flippase family protein [Patescibacteria group bacterium]
MVRDIISRLSSPIRGLHQAAYLLAALTLVSQILALVRDHIFARLFGAGEILDLYYGAFKIPDLVFALVASLVSAYVLIPKIAELEREDAKKLISQAASFLLIGGGVICIVLIIFAPYFLFLIYPTFAHSTHAASFVLLARILLIQPLLLGFSGVITSVTQTQRRFILFALSPVLYNIGIIIGTVFLYPLFGLPGIGLGVVLGAAAHVSIHIPIVLRAKLFPHFTFPTPKAMWPIVKDSIPRSMALGMSAITTLVLISIISRTGTGGVSVFTFASNLESVPLSLIASSYATAAFPVLAEQISKKKFEEYRATITTAARHIIFWSAVITVLTMVLRAHIVRIVLGSGAFNWDDTRITAAVLALLILGLLAQGIILLASRAFYAAHRSWNPLFVQLGDAGVSVGVALLMLRLSQTYPMFRYFVESLFRVSDVPGTSVLFIAIGATVGQLILCGVALATLRVVAPGVAHGLSRPIFDGFGAAILGGTAAYGALALMGNLAPLTSSITVFTQGAVAGMVGLAVAAAVLSLLENQEFKDLYSSLQKLRNSRALTPFGAVISNSSQ